VVYHEKKEGEKRDDGLRGQLAKKGERRREKGFEKLSWSSRGRNAHARTTPFARRERGPKSDAQSSPVYQPEERGGRRRVQAFSERKETPIKHLLWRMEGKARELGIPGIVGKGEVWVREWHSFVAQWGGREKGIRTDNKQKGDDTSVPSP